MIEILVFLCIPEIKVSMNKKCQKYSNIKGFQNKIEREEVLK